MKIKNNFISVVTIGNFNPAILTHDFLTKVCGFQLDDRPQEEHKTPVVSRIKYSGINLMVELDRFQIVEYGVANPEESEVTKYLRIYLEKLPYTPIFICGVNLNINISGLDGRRVAKLLTDQRCQLFQKLETKDFTIESLSRYQEAKEEQHTKWNITYSPGENEILVRIGLNKIKESDWRVNYNYEVRGLDKEHERLERIILYYPEIVKRYRRVINKLFEEV